MKLAFSPAIRPSCRGACEFQYGNQWRDRTSNDCELFECSSTAAQVRRSPRDPWRLRGFPGINPQRFPDASGINPRTRGDSSGSSLLSPLDLGIKQKIGFFACGAYLKNLLSEEEPGRPALAVDSSSENCCGNSGP